MIWGVRRIRNWRVERDAASLQKLLQSWDASEGTGAAFRRGTDARRALFSCLQVISSERRGPAHGNNHNFRFSLFDTLFAAPRFVVRVLF